MLPLHAGERTASCSTAASGARRVLIALNPKAGRRSVERSVVRLAHRLAAAGCRAEIFTDLSQVADQANRLFESGDLRALVAVGGDGTLAELVNRSQPGLPLAIFPAGTANLVARHFGLRADTEQLSRSILAGDSRLLDAGSASGRLFLVMASCGFDADVVNRVHRCRLRNSSGGHIRYTTYLKPILESIRTYSYPQMRIDSCGADADHRVAARWAFVFNLPCYAWGLPLVPTATGDDGLLDLCTFERGSLGDGLRYLAAAQLGWHRRLTDCRIEQNRRFRVTSDEPVPYQLDGDPGGMLPLEIEVLPQRVSLLVPPK
jgi:diacylglycerol kinase family enzyme